MRKAIRRPPRDGVLDSVAELFLSFYIAFLDPKPEISDYPSFILPRRPAHSARPRLLLQRWRLLGACYPKKSRSKRPPKNDQILMPYQHRFWSVLAPFLEAKMAPKSIKNLSNFGFRAFLFRHRFLYRFWSIFCPNFDPWKLKNYWNSDGF